MLLHSMNKSEANAIVGNLSKTSKMPGPSFGLSAFDCKTGSKLREVKGSVCSKCYARKGMYVFPNVKEAHASRMAKLVTAIENPDARRQWVSAMVSLLSGVEYFRWHDSGDLQSREHFDLICDVARASPATKHWLPTKEPRYASRENLPDNLVVRVSAPMIDGEPVKHWPNTSTVVTGEASCHAPDNGGKCGDCRQCWDKNVANVSYHLH